MINIFKYKGYAAKVEYAVDDVFVGRLTAANRRKTKTNLLIEPLRN